MTNTPKIVNLNTTEVVAPTNPHFQQSGALISVGGTNLPVGTYQFCATAQAVHDILSTTVNYE